MLSYEAGADAVGFVFAPSKRRVTPAQVKAITAQLPAGKEMIGVFVNEPADRLVNIVNDCALTGIQLQGDESPGFVSEMRMQLPQGTRITKTLHAHNIHEEASLFFTAGVRPVDSILVDSGTAIERGGSGQTFNWLELQHFIDDLQEVAPVIIAGGLDPQNVGGAVALFRPFGVDVATGVERGPGRKDPEKLRAFVASVRAAELDQPKVGT